MYLKKMPFTKLSVEQHMIHFSAFLFSILRAKILYYYSTGDHTDAS